jgi:FMN phosphatase YigB (HAD superfamily)
VRRFLLGLEPDDVVYVGNSRWSHVVGLGRAGIRAAWVNREGRRVPDDGVTAWRVVPGLADLPG